jgi:hypothetical protein
MYGSHFDFTGKSKSTKPTSKPNQLCEIIKDSKRKTREILETLDTSTVKFTKSTKTLKRKLPKLPNIQTIKNTSEKSNLVKTKVQKLKPNSSTKSNKPTKKIIANPVKSPDEKPKERRGRKRKTVLPTKIPYDWQITYDNTALPTIRYPETKSVPDHLIPEFKQNIHLILPKTTKKQKKTRGYPLEPNRDISGLEEGYISLLKKFWTPDRLNVLVEILVPSACYVDEEEHEDNPRVTLSLVDWFCINYSRHEGVSYPTSREKEFMVNLEYRKNLSASLRPFFDVYCRGDRILIEYVDNDCNIQVKNPNSTEIQWDNKKQVGVRMVGEDKMVYIITTVGQLNFFKWAIINMVIDYCEKNARKIKYHMKRTKDTPNSDGNKRRKLFQSKDQSWFIKGAGVTIEFDFNNNPFDGTEDPPSENEYEENQPETYIDNSCIENMDATENTLTFEPCENIDDNEQSVGDAGENAYNQDNDYTDEQSDENQMNDTEECEQISENEC